jgi:phage terminase small subunit
MGDRKLNPRQRAFAEHYAASGNATEAARLAGYAEPNKQGPRLLVNVGVTEYVKSLTVSSQKKRIATAEERQEWWTKVMLGEEVEADFKDRLKASELLGRSHADFVDRQEVSGKNGGPVKTITKIELVPFSHDAED